jgi:hypothetical protein
VGNPRAAALPMANQPGAPARPAEPGSEGGKAAAGPSGASYSAFGTPVSSGQSRASGALQSSDSAPTSSAGDVAVDPRGGQSSAPPPVSAPGPSERFLKGVEGVLVAGLGAVEIAGAAALVEAPPLAGLIAVEGAGTLAAGLTQFTGALAGDTKSGEEGAKAVESVSTVSGAATLIATRDPNMASTVASGERLLVSGSELLVEGKDSTVERTAAESDSTVVRTMVSGGLNVYNLATGAAETQSSASSAPQGPVGAPVASQPGAPPPPREPGVLQ